MEPSTTWFYRSRLRFENTLRNFRALIEAKSRTDESDEEPEDTTEEGETPDAPYTALPADNVLGFEKSSYVFNIEATGEGNPYSVLGIACGTVRARTAQWEAPTSYELVDAPTIAEGSFGVTRDGLIVWRGETFPGSIVDAERINHWTDWNPAQVNTAAGVYNFKVQAELRAQVAEANVRVNLIKLDEFRTRNSLTFNSASTSDPSEAHHTVAGLPIGSQHAGWTYAVPSPIPLPDANLRALWAALQGLGNLIFNVGKAFVSAIQRLNPFSSNDDEETIEWTNPYRSRDFPTNAQVGGVIIRPGFIPLKNITAHRVDLSGIANVKARLVRDPNLATRENTEVAPDKLEVVVKPFGAEIVAGPASSTPLNINNLRRDYGLCVVWYPKERHVKHIIDEMELTITDVNGVEEIFNFPIQSRNIHNYIEDLGHTGIDAPEVGACTLGWAYNFNPLFPNGDFETERNLVYGSDYDSMVAIMPLNLCTIEANPSDREFFVTRLHRRLGIYNTAKGSAFQFIITGKIIGWQVSWCTASDSGSMYLWPNTWASNFVGAGLGLVTNFGYEPAGTKNSGSIPSGVTMEEVIYERDTAADKFSPFGPHLQIQASQHGGFKFKATSSPGSTLIQIRPYVHEWNALTIPLPVGPVAKWVYNTFIRVLSRFGLARAPRGLVTQLASEQVSVVHRMIQQGWNPSAAVRHVTSDAYTSFLLRQIGGQRLPWASRIATRLSTALSVGGGLPVPARTGRAERLVMGYTQRQLKVHQAARITTQAWVRNGQATIRQATLAQQAYDRQAAIINLRSNRASWEGFYTPPAVNNVVWTGDWICGRVNTLPAGADVTDLDRLAVRIDFDAADLPPITRGPG